QVVRTVAIDELVVGPPAYPTLPLPLVVPAFTPEYVAAGLDLHGSWSVTDDGWLDANAAGADQAGFSTHQTASSTVWLDLSSAVQPVMNLTLELALTHENDRAYVEVLRRGDTEWRKLATWTLNDDTEGEAITQLS